MSRSAIEESLAAALAHVEEAAARAHTLKPDHRTGNTPLPVHPGELADALQLVSKLVRRLGVTLGRYGDVLLNAPDTGRVPAPLLDPTTNAGHEIRALGKTLHTAISARDAYNAIGMLDDTLATWSIQRRRAADDLTSGVKDPRGRPHHR